LYDDEDYETIHDFAVDHRGNVFIVGYSQRDEKFYVSGYDSDGNEQWINWHSVDDDKAKVKVNYITVDNLGNVYTMTYFTSEDMISESNRIDYITKYDYDGTQVWKVRYGKEGKNTPSSISFDNLGNVYVIGSSTRFLDSNTTCAVRGGMYTHQAYDTDYLTVKYDSDGNELWSDKYDGILSDIGTRIAVDNLGNVYALGTSNSEQCGDTWSYRIGNNYTLIKYDFEGNMIWVDENHGIGVDLKIDSSGNVYSLINIITDNYQVNTSIIKYS